MNHPLKLKKSKKKNLQRTIRDKEGQKRPKTHKEENAKDYYEQQMGKKRKNREKKYKAHLHQKAG
jgi:hypothetical protein